MGRRAFKTNTYQSICFSVPSEVKDRFTRLVQSSSSKNKTQHFIRYVNNAYRKIDQPKQDDRPITKGTVPKI